MITVTVCNLMIVLFQFDVGYNIAYKTLKNCSDVQFLVYPEVPWSYKRMNDDEDERNTNITST